MPKWSLSELDPHYKANLDHQGQIISSWHTTPAVTGSWAWHQCKTGHALVAKRSFCKVESVEYATMTVGCLWALRIRTDARYHRLHRFSNDKRDGLSSTSVTVEFITSPHLVVSSMVWSHNDSTTNEHASMSSRLSGQY